VRHFHTIAVSEDKGKGEGPMKFLWKCGSIYSLVGDRHCGARWFAEGWFIVLRLRSVMSSVYIIFNQHKNFDVAGCSNFTRDLFYSMIAVETLIYQVFL